MRRVVILGSTGSIGTQAIEVISRHRGRFEVVGLAAGGGHPELLIEQARALQVPLVAVSDDRAAGLVAQALPEIEVWGGPDAATGLAAIDCEVVLNGITGAAGLGPTLATLAAGTTLALANKESLVIGGRLVTDAAAPGQIVPVDSEHSAFAQALRSGRAEEVHKLILTASGGPFRGFTSEQLRTVTPEQALAHPTWNMGRVVTINSATLMNKGLELIEAALLFGIDFADIEVVVHPQSVVHSMVEFRDGSTIAQCSPPDMRLPIALGLSWPERLGEVAQACDWRSATSWTFEPLDAEVFPAVELARHAGTLGGIAPAIFNAANEVCVDAFCAGDLEFSGIVEVVAEVLAAHGEHATPDTLSVASVLSADALARQAASERIKER
ncbi:MAG: 1-deoxy-D-xylulose-5-phosphate reductoisomerase [Propionicimonas sp.]